MLIELQKPQKINNRIIQKQNIIIIEYQKIMNLLDNTPNQTTKCRTKNWVEIKFDSRGTYNTNNQIKLKTTMLKTSLCDYSDVHILVSGTITNTGAAVDDAVKWLDERNKGVIFKNCATFTDCISEINNTQINNAKYLDVLMQMYNLIEYSDNYSKISGGLWHYYRDDPNNNITQSESFKSKIKITGNTSADSNKKDVKIAVPLKYLSNFWRAFEMRLINCEIYFILTLSKTCVIISATGKTEFAVTETKFYLPVVTLSTQDNVKRL